LGANLQKAHNRPHGGPAGTICRIPGDLGHDRIWEAGEKKEDDEAIRFYRLPMVEMHCGGRNLIAKEAAVFYSWLVLLVAVLHVVVVMQEGWCTAQGHAGRAEGVQSCRAGRRCINRVARGGTPSCRVQHKGAAQAGGVPPGRGKGTCSGVQEGAGAGQAHGQLAAGGQGDGAHGASRAVGGREQMAS
jgi:hypothetical protein